jgi:hypothetical protein
VGRWALATPAVQQQHIIRVIVHARGVVLFYLSPLLLPSAMRSPLGVVTMKSHS